MATRIITLTGTASWAKVFEDNRDMKGFEGAYEDFDGAYTIEVELDKENFDKLKTAGSMKKGRISDGGITVKFDRKHKTAFEWASGAPTVVNAEGNKWNFEDDGPIGNGSEVEVTVAVYDTKRPSIKGTRLEKVKVIEAADLPEVERVPF